MFGKKYDTATTDEMPSSFTAGCGRIATDEEIEMLYKRFSEKPITSNNKAFIIGFLNGLQFSSVPSDAETFGFDAYDFVNNAFGWFLDDLMKDELRAVSDIINKIIGDDDDE